MSANGDEQGAIVPNALAHYFGCAPTEIGAYVVCCERIDDEGRVIASSVWAGASLWLLLGLVSELRAQLERIRDASAREAME